MLIMHVAKSPINRYISQKHLNANLPLGCFIAIERHFTTAQNLWSVPETNIFEVRGERKNLMDVQTVLIWIVIGAVAGLLAESMVGGPRRTGLGTAILIGILGAFIGGWLFSALGIAIGGGIIGTIITAFIGAVLLLLIVRGVRR
jgi:uncharacterized membrane protein YeaQ/YmgE (transglycosylase-associated protein family)